MQTTNTAGETLYQIKCRSGRTTITAHIFAASEHDAKRKAAGFCEEWQVQTGRVAITEGVEVAS